MVEKRKLQRLGGSLFISLPETWVKEWSLEKGSVVEMDVNEGQVTIAPSVNRKLRENAALDFSLRVFREIIKEYLLGVKRISVLKKTGFSQDDRRLVIESAGKLMNVEVVEESKTKIVLQNSVDADSSILPLIQRMYLLTYSMLDDLMSARKLGEFKAIIDRDSAVGKLYLNAIMHIRCALSGAPQGKQSKVELMDVRILIEKLERIADEIKLVAQEIMDGLKIPKIQLEFLLMRYETAYFAFIEKDAAVAGNFWVWEKQDKSFIHPRLLRAYDLIKDISDLVI